MIKDTVLNSGVLIFIGIMLWRVLKVALNIQKSILNYENTLNAQGEDIGDLKVDISEVKKLTYNNTRDIQIIKALNKSGH
jgi:hypothetical protein